MQCQEGISTEGVLAKLDEQYQKYKFMEVNLVQKRLRYSISLYYNFVLKLLVGDSREIFVTFLATLVPLHPFLALTTTSPIFLFFDAVLHFKGNFYSLS